MYRITLVIALLFSLLVCGCARVSYPLRISVTDWEQQQADEILKGYGNLRLENSELLGFFTQISNRLTQNSNGGNAGIRFFIVNSTIVNAFALPDGTILLTSGLLMQLDDPNDIAAIIAHEIAHVTLRHHQKSALYKQIAENSLSRDTSLGDEEKKLVSLLKRLGYSRTQEYEADELAQYLLTKAGLPSDQYKRMLEKLLVIEHYNREASEKDDNEEAQLFSTHPNTDDRIQVLDVSRYKGEGAFLFSAEQYRTLLTQAPVYHSHAPMIKRKDALYVRQGAFAFRVQGTGVFSQLTVDAGKIRAEKNQAHFQILAGEKIEERLQTFLEQTFFSYQYKKPEVLSDNPHYLKGVSKINPSECMILKLLPTGSNYIAVWQERNLDCKISGALALARTSIVDRVVVEALTAHELERPFMLKLEYVDESSGGEGQYLEKAGLINPQDPAEILKWLNLFSNVPGKVKVLH